jgi:hypothetical protein
MRTQETKLPKKRESNLEDLQRSPIRGVHYKPSSVDITLLDIDETNPGSDKYSARYQKRETPINESYDILGAIVYPLVISEKGDGSGRFWIVDGHGRYGELARRGTTTVNVYIYPPLSLEQRILLRQTLNAAQAPFDTGLVIRDLFILAKERGLDVRNDKDLRALVADLPDNVREQYKKLKMLAQWPTDIVEKISVDADTNSESLGVARLNELNGLVTTIKKYHSEVGENNSGYDLHRKVVSLYQRGTFRDGCKSDQGIRDAKSALRAIPEDDPMVEKFLEGKVTLPKLRAIGQAHKATDEGETLLDLCKSLNTVLTDAEWDDLEPAEQKALKQLNRMIMGAMEDAKTAVA